ncbi:hypothetical protein ACFQ36_03480 [Arthrobacter sp. GCM10027362]|uniref:hypothetical protein n=1 Tax=Arthrobacter sp. GCM10027362 TaxID=3273379 RepID=UPI0036434D6E
MPIAILYYLAAGAIGVGGPAAAVLLFRLGQQEGAAHLRRRDAESLARLLRTETDLATRREQARAAGVDPDLVEQGYRDLRDGLVTINQLLAHLRRFSLE